MPSSVKGIPSEYLVCTLAHYIIAGEAILRTKDAPLRRASQRSETIAVPGWTAVATHLGIGGAVLCLVAWLFAFYFSSLSPQQPARAPRREERSVTTTITEAAGRPGDLKHVAWAARRNASGLRAGSRHAFAAGAWMVASVLVLFGSVAIFALEAEFQKKAVYFIASSGGTAAAVVALLGGASSTVAQLKERVRSWAYEMIRRRSSRSSGSWFSRKY